MLRIAIDGACRNNGKPDCIAAGGLFVADYCPDGPVTYYTSSTFAKPSTSQRGELMALDLALEEVLFHNVDAQIITDSEYLFNTVTKEWYKGWASRDWLTATLEPVKNVDIWKKIVASIQAYQARNIDVVFYHIKGHCVPLGKVTTATLLAKDDSGLLLYDALNKKFTESYTSISSKLDIAQDLSIKNNGFKLDDKTLRDFTVMNTVADAVATRCVESAVLCLA